MLLLPPQATKPAASIAKTSKPKASFTRRCFPAANWRSNQPNNRTPAPGRNQRGRFGRRNAADGAVVATVNCEPVPPGVTELVVRLQVL